VVVSLVGAAFVLGRTDRAARLRWAVRRPGVGSRPQQVTPKALLTSLRRWSARRPRRTVLLAGIVAGLGGLPAGGPVAAVAIGAYAALAARAVLRRWSAKEAAAGRARTLDELSAVAADLRAGLPPSAVGFRAATGAAGGQADGVGAAVGGGPADGTARTVVGAGGPADGTARAVVGAGGAADGVGAVVGGVRRSVAEVRIRELTAAAWRLAERTGAPVADLVDRIEADARAADRARAAASAQAAGARATAMLLAGLPIGGIALGYAIGADPLRVLLHTPLGAGCVVGALALQLAGLAWADRLANAGALR
jgi:tight adherence protein B